MSSSRASTSLLARAAPPWVARIGALAAVLGLWQLGSNTGVVSPYLLPSPTVIAAAFVELFQQNDIPDAFVRSTIETLGAFVLGSAVGLSIGWLLHRFRHLGDAYTDWIGAMGAAPLVLLYPVFLVVVGRNEWTVVTMGAIVACPSVALKTKEGLDGVRPVLLAVGRTMNLSGWAMFRLIQAPAALPAIFVGLRLGLVFALINTVGVEFLLGLDGLGQLISDLGDRFDLGQMYAATVFVIVISAIFLYVTERVESWLLWTR